MKGIIKGLIIGGIIAAIGVVILVITLSVNGCSAADSKFESSTFTATGDNTVLDINVGAGTVTTRFYDGDKVVIEYPVSDILKSEVKENNGRVTFKSKIKPFIFLGVRNIPDTVIKLPKDKIFDLEVDVDAGSVNIAGGKYGNVTIDIDAGSFNSDYIECTGLKCDIDAGKIDIKEAKCNTLICDIDAGKLDINKVTCHTARIDLSAGAADIGFTGKKEEYSISAKVSAGSCNVGAQTGTTDKSITVDVSAGSANIKFAV